jgi:GT2 family glycosyltransferase
VKLDGDYGLEEGKWLKYREQLLKLATAANPPKTAGSGRLWVCMTESGPSGRIDVSRLASNVSALKGGGGTPPGFMLLLDDVAGGPRELPGLDITPVSSVLIASKLMGDDDSIIFTSVDDVLDARMARVLEGRGAFAADFVLFDFYYVDGQRAYPVLLHGVDALHATHCDYFFSRFMVSARLLKQVVGKQAVEGGTPLPLRDVAVRCLSAARPSSTAHVPIPLFRAGLCRRQVAAAKAAACRRSVSGRAGSGNVSAIICTKDNHFLLQQLVWRLRAEPSVKDIVIVSNNSSAEGMLSLLGRLEGSGAATILKYDKPFNFSEQCNLAAKSATGDSLLFLNDDIAPVNEDWLELLVESAAWNGGSIAGPLLIYPDQTVQHGGMFLGYRNVAGHLMRHSALPDETSTFALCAPRKVSCLTGAVLLVPRRTFEDMNGFDTMLAHYAQDVDLCMRASGMGVDLVFDPRSVLMHFESVSVKPILADDRVRQAREREFEYFRRRWPVLKDEWLNPNVSMHDETTRSLIRP